MNGHYGVRESVWPLEPLGEHVEVLRGVTYKKHEASKEPGCGRVALLRATNIQQKLTFDDLVFVPASRVASFQYLRQGDILVAASSGSRNAVGKTAQLTTDWTGTYGAFCFVLRPKSEADPRYLAWFLQTPIYRERISELAAGVNINNLRARHIQEMPIPVPPPDDQRRIVEEIEKQLTRLDAGVAALNRIQVNLKRYRAAVLKAACEGRLVPTEAELARQEGRSFEHASVVLKRIKAEKAKLATDSRRRSHRTADPSLPPDLPPLPEGWAWSTLGDLATLVRNGISKRPEGDSGQPILRISAVRPMSVNVSDIRFLGGDPTAYHDFRLEPGDLLFTRYNGNPELVGVCAVFPTVANAMVHPDKLIRVKTVATAFLPSFAAVTANTGASRSFLVSRARTTAGQTGVSGADLKQTPIPVAPLSEQHRIVVEVERLLSFAENLDRSVVSGLFLSSVLRRALLASAFSGAPGVRGQSNNSPRVLSDG